MLNGSGSGRSRGRGKVRRLSLVFFAIALVAAISAVVFFIFARSARIGAPPAASSTTIWPYGLPEYALDIPQDYEALLPENLPETEPTGGAQSGGAHSDGMQSGGAQNDSVQNGGAHSGAQDAKAAPATAVAPPDALVPTPPQKPQKSAAPKPAAPYSAAPKPAAPKPAARPQRDSYIALEGKKRLESGGKPTLIIVIDDVGYNLQQLSPFLALPFPLSLAVLPELEHSAESARRAQEAGKEVLLHQPMEAQGHNNTGPGAVLVAMADEEAAAVMGKNLNSLPQAAGVNNHMGSAVTRDERLMRSLLSLVKSRGIYYLDSLTASGTATAALCRELSIPYWERDVFLDNSGDKQSILLALEEGKKIASSRGASVLIGHVWSAELAQTLMDIYPLLVEEGYSLSTISKFMMQSAAGDDDARSGD